MRLCNWIAVGSVMLATALVAAGGQTGHVQLKCEPDALIFLDDVFRGKTEAKLGGMILQDVPAGSHVLRALKEGFPAREARITVLAGKVLLHEFPPLGGQADVGSLVIQSLPIECVVDLSAAGLSGYQKHVDELERDRVPAGTHTARFTALGKTLSCRFTLEANATLRLFVNFPREKVTVERLSAARELALDLGDGVTMKLVLIPAGKFWMGSPPDEKDRDRDEGPRHQVSIGKPYYMALTEVTQKQYAAVTGHNPAVGGGARFPVTPIRWEQAVAFCKTLSQRTGRTVRLPTEAEWEHACRAGGTTRFCSGDAEDLLDRFAWHSRNSRRQIHPVAAMKPNAWGLYDMHGNVSEWCLDWYAPSYPGKAQVDPTGPALGESHVLRGGSYGGGPWHCRSASRHQLGAREKRYGYGFRPVVEVD